MAKPGTDKTRTIELGRKFLEIPDIPGEIDPDELVRAALALSRGQAWPQLLAHRYIVVLGEAGTGKTTEFRRQADALTNAGEWAFFVEISALANHGLHESLSPEEEEQLGSWRRSESEAVVFLDSLDEAKLQRHTLRGALLRLRRDLREEWSRVRLVVSCRASDWRADADRADVEAGIPSDRDDKLRVVQIAPLDLEQVARLAAYIGVSDVAGFARAIAENYAQNFVERPLDVIWLGTYWQRLGHLGSQQELVAENIRQKLIEPTQRPVFLTRTKAEEGARALAGIGTLTHRLSLLLPDEPRDLKRAKRAIDPHDVLADWSNEEVQDLLRRPLFDESTYGRVRFHHRSIQEYLTATWLRELHQTGLSRMWLRDLFFREEGGELVIPEHLAPVLAWLCLWDATLRTETIRETPALLIAYGDPSGFNVIDREAILRSYASGYAGRARRFDDFTMASLDRFASPALAEALASLLSQPELPDELTGMLFQLVKHGRVRDCVPHALKVALDVNGAQRGRIAAIRAIAGVGDDDQRRQLLSLVDTTETWQQDVAGAFVRALYPEVLDVDGLMRLIARAEPKRQNVVTSLQVVLEHEVPELGDATLRLELLEKLMLLAHVEDASGTRSIDPAQAWLLGPLGHIVASVLDALPRDTDQPALVSEALELFRWCNEHGYPAWQGLEEVREAVTRYPEVRRSLFWRQVGAHREQTGSIPTRYYELRHSYELFELGSDDVGWLANDALTRQDFRQRLLAFDALARVPRTQDERERHLDMLRKVSSEDAALRRRLERMLNSSGSNYPRQSVWERERRARDLKRARHQLEEQATLEHSLDSIRAGSDLNALYFLLRKAQEQESSNFWSIASIEPLRQLYGETIAEAAAQGWRAFWPTYDPPLPHERTQRNSIPGQVVIGLVGISVDFAAGMTAGSLAPSLIIKASRYAASELNGLPGWLTLLADARPDLVAQALEPALAADYGHPEPVHDVLAKLPTADMAVRAACAPVLLRLVLAADASTVDALNQAISVILSTENIDLLAFDSAIADRCRAAVAERRRFGVWWYTWVNRKSLEALDFLDQLLRGIPNQEGYELVEEVCHRIHEGLGQSPVALRSDVAALSRLIPIVYDYIAIKDDIDHEGVYSPGRRDDAQEVRSMLLSWLSDVPGQESAVSLRRVADDPRLVTVRDRILYQLDKRLVANVGMREPDLTEQLLNLYMQHGTQARNYVGQIGGELIDMRVLFLASNPYGSNQLALDEEARDIQQKLRASDLRDRIAFVTRWAVRPDDLQQALLEADPTIVHMSGHGAETGDVLLHGEAEGDEHLVSPDALHSLFQVLRARIRVVVLNYCHSAAQARTIVETVDIVVGMSNSINDEAARRFAASFYRGLGFGRSVADAFQLGVSELELTGHAADKDVPVLFTRAGVNASTTVLATRG